MLQICTFDLTVCIVHSQENRYGVEMVLYTLNNVNRHRKIYVHRHKHQDHD